MLASIKAVASHHSDERLLQGVSTEQFILLDGRRRRAAQVSDGCDTVASMQRHGRGSCLGGRRMVRRD